MARKYVRDNRGRFSSVGATARGGRLRTASGNKRATVTAKGPKRANTVAKPAGLKPGALAARRTARPPAKPPARTPLRSSTANVPKRLQFDVAYHGTNSWAAGQIRKGKFRESTEGVKGPGVYSTPIKQEAQFYMNRGWVDKSLQPGAMTGALLRLRIPKGTRNIERADYNAKGWAMKGGDLYDAGKGANWYNSSDRAIVLPGALADRYLDRSTGVIRRRRRKP